MEELQGRANQEKFQTLERLRRIMPRCDAEVNVRLGGGLKIAGGAGGSGKIMR